MLVAAYGCAASGDGASNDPERSSETGGSAGDKGGGGGAGAPQAGGGGTATAGSSGGTSGGAGDNGGGGSAGQAAGGTGTGGKSGGGTGGHPLGTVDSGAPGTGGIQIFEPDASATEPEDSSAPLLPGACDPNISVHVPLEGGAQARVDPLGRSAVCIAVEGTVQGWGCQGLEKRTVTINGTRVTCNSSTPFPAPLSDGFRYVFITALPPPGDAGNIGNTGGLWFY